MKLTWMLFITLINWIFLYQQHLNTEVAWCYHVLVWVKGIHKKNNPCNCLFSYNFVWVNFKANKRILFSSYNYSLCCVYFEATPGLKPVIAQYTKRHTQASIQSYIPTSDWPYNEVRSKLEFEYHIASNQSSNKFK